MSDISQISNANNWLPIIGSLGATLITGLIAIGVTWINKRSEERKHKQQLIIQAAIANWNRDYDIAKEHQKAGHTVRLTPLDIYLIHHMKLVEVLMDPKITISNIDEKLSEVENMTEKTLKWYKQTARNNKYFNS